MDKTDLISQIAEDVATGARFVPLLGAGFSAEAGIPTATELRTFLRFCIRKVLDERWCPRSDRWPELADAYQKRYEDDDLEVPVNLPMQARPLAYAASGTRGDWREMLRFLARVERDPDGAITLGAHSEAVVDAAFVHVTAGRTPTLSHAMLAHLTDPLRIRTVLTTNFDSLVESAFERMAMPLQVFDVHLKAGLPSGRLVLASRSIVKLHGTRFGLRADETLDGPPSREDEAAFISYLQAGGAEDMKDSRVRLLVMGASGYEPRTLCLLAAAMRALAQRLAIYWICYRDSEPADVRKLLAATLGTKDLPIKIAVERSLGRFLLETYQRAVLSLPPAGADFEAFPPRAPLPYAGTAAFDPKRLSEAATRLKKVVEQSRTKLIAVGGRRPSGISTVAARVFDEMCTETHSLWFDLDVYRDPSHFYAALVHEVAVTVAERVRMPLLPEYDWKSCRSDLVGLARNSARRFVIWVNGRDGLGDGASFNPDASRSRKWRELWDHLVQISHGDSHGDYPMTFVVLWGKGNLPSPRLPAELYESFDVDPPIVRQKRAAVLKAILACIRQRADAPDLPMLRFVYALLLMQRPRYPAVTWSWALLKAPQRGRSEGGDNDEERYRTARDILHWLAHEVNLGRYQAGGGFWIHRDVRTDVRRGLERAFARDTRELAVECHQGLADWYVKLFRASNDPTAALESIFHRLSCAQAARSLGRPVFGEKMEVTSLLEAVQTIELARERILAGGFYGHFKEVVREVATVGRRIGAVAALVQRRLDAVQLEYARDVGHFEDALPKTARAAEGHRDTLVRTASLIGLRAYQKAAEEMRQLLAALQLDGVPVMTAQGEAALGYGGRASGRGRGAMSATKELIPHLRDVAHKWSRRKEEATLQLAIRALRRNMFFLMLNAQLCQLTDHVAAGRLLLLATEGNYVVATTIMRYCSDHAFLQEENANVRCHAGVMLGNLGRFHEAHRRLNEAWAYLLRAARARRTLLGAIIDLRRAEVYLLQVERARLDRQPEAAYALLEEARTALSRAANRWRNEPARTWWRTLGCELALRVTRAQLEIRQANGEERPWAAREARQEQAWRELKEGVRLVRADVYRMARLTDLWLEIAARAGWEAHRQELRLDWDSVAEARQRLVRRGIQRVSWIGSYVNRVQELLKTDG